MHTARESSNNACCVFIAVFNNKKSPCFVQYQTSNKVAIQIKGRGIERELTVERVVGVFPVSSRKLPSGSGVKPQLQMIFGRFIRNIVRFYAWFEASCPSTAKVIIDDIARKNCNNCHD